MISDFRGLKVFILEHLAQVVVRDFPFKNDYLYLKEFMDKNYKEREFGYIELNSRLGTLKIISSEETFTESLKHITGQGLYIFVKKTVSRAGPWRCIRCQKENIQTATFCTVCRLTR